MVSSLLNRRDKGRILISGLEHPSLWEPVQGMIKLGWDVKVINPGRDGLISTKKLKKMVTEETQMVLIMGVHNETGVIQPLDELIQVIRECHTKRDVHIHSDLVQALGKISLSMRKTGLDSASFSAHKIRGPRGTGLLYQKRLLSGLVTGGGQEKGVRPGTENLPGIAGFTKALELVPSSLETSREARKRMRFLMDGIQKIPGAQLLPENRREMDDHYTPWILNCTFPPLPGEVLVRVLDEAGFAVSTGSACSSNKKSRTRALESMGVSHETAFSSIRISQGPATTMVEIESFLTALKEQIHLVGRAVR
jgi:cysteine desulfurase